MNLLRPEIAALEQNGITRVALTRIGDPDVIALWFGEGDSVTEGFIREAAKEALDAGDTFYTHTRGKQALRDALKRYLDALYGIDLHPDRITVPGSTMLGVTIAAQMALSTGDHAIIVGPVWPNIESTYRATGAEVDYVRQRRTDAGWQLDLADIRAALRPRTRSLFVNTPCNPTGWVMPAAQQAELLQLCRERNILLIADEVYHRNVYDGDVAPSFMTLARDDDPVIVVNGFSKAWAMTGWRIGWVVAPSRFAETWAILSECFNTGATVFVQQAAITALERGGGCPPARSVRKGTGDRDRGAGALPAYRAHGAKRCVVRVSARAWPQVEPRIRRGRARGGGCRHRARVHLRPRQRGAFPALLRPFARGPSRRAGADRPLHRAPRQRVRVGPNQE